jgi:hypothetical protein
MTQDYDEYDDFGVFGTSPLTLIIGLGATVLAVIGITRLVSAQAGGHNMEISVMFGGSTLPGNKQLRRIGQRIKEVMGTEKCPGAPKVSAIVKRLAPQNVEAQGGGPALRVVYLVRAKFAVDPETGEQRAFDPGATFLKKKAADCVFAQLKAISDIGGRIIGMRAERVA